MCTVVVTRVHRLAISHRSAVLSRQSFSPLTPTLIMGKAVAGSASRFSLPSYSFEMIRLDLPVERPFADAQHLGRTAAVARVLLERRFYRGLLHVGHGHPRLVEHRLRPILLLDLGDQVADVGMVAEVDDLHPLGP